MKLAPLHAPAAFRVGWAAAMRGAPVTANPYSKRRYRHQFKEGWAHGKKENP